MSFFKDKMCYFPTRLFVCLFVCLVVARTEHYPRGPDPEIGKQEATWESHGGFLCSRKEPVRFDSFRFRTFRKFIDSVRFGSVRVGKLLFLVRCGSACVFRIRRGSVRFGSVPRPAPAGSGIKQRFGSVRFGSVRFGSYSFLSRHHDHINTINTNDNNNADNDSVSYNGTNHSPSEMVSGPGSLLRRSGLKAPPREQRRGLRDRRYC